MSNFAEELLAISRELSVALATVQSSDGFLTSGQEQTGDLVELVGQTTEGSTRELVSANASVSEAKTCTKFAIELIMYAIAVIQGFREQKNLL